METKTEIGEYLPSHARCAFLQFTHALATCALFRRNNGDPIEGVCSDVEEDE